MTSLNNIPEIIRTEQAFLQQTYGIQSLTLYGSYARSAQSKHSDIDIMYEMQAGRAMSLRRLQKVELLIKSLLNVEKVELVNKTYMNPIVFLNAQQDAIFIF